MEKQPVELNLVLPPNFFDSPQEDMCSPSPSEALAHAMLWHVMGLDADDIKKGSPAHKEPDCMVSTGEGIEVVWGENDVNMRVFDGSNQPDGCSTHYGTVEVVLKERIQKKYNKLRKGNYSGASKVTLFCLLVSSLPLWYCMDQEYAYYSDYGLADKMIMCERDLFWKALQYQYIGTDKFSNIYIACPTLDGKYACFNINNLASGKHGITIFNVSDPNCVPVYRRIDYSETPITSKTPCRIHIISMTNEINLEERNVTE